MLNTKRQKLSLLCLWLILIATTNNTLTNNKVSAQVTPPPQDIIPPRNDPSPFPENPKQPPSPEEILPQTTPEENSETNLVGSIQVIKFNFIGNTVFSSEELSKIEVLSPPQSIGEIQNQELTFNQLVQIATKVTEYYNEAGYQTSGAVLILPEVVTAETTAEVTINIIEGTLEQIEVRQEGKEGGGKLGNYVRSRLGVDLEKPLNINQLLEALQLLQIDPLVENLAAQLAVGSDRGKNILVVNYRPARTFRPQVFLDNSRSPSIGTFQRGVELREDNLFGLGDSIALQYSNTDGSNGVEARYRIPINAQNGTIGFNFTWTDNEVIEPPFDDIDGDGKTGDITSENYTYELAFRQPIIRRIQGQVFEEVILGLTTSLRDSQSYLLDTGFPLSPGAEEDGKTRVFAVRFSQEYTRQSAVNILGFRS